jgi:hypothetical protein
MIVSYPNQSQHGIYLVVHFMSVSLCRIGLSTLWGVERLGDSTVVWWQNDSALGCA